MTRQEELVWAAAFVEAYHRQMRNIILDNPKAATHDMQEVHRKTRGRAILDAWGIVMEMRKAEEETRATFNPEGDLHIQMLRAMLEDKCPS